MQHIIYNKSEDLLDINLSEPTRQHRSDELVMKILGIWDYVPFY